MSKSNELDSINFDLPKNKSNVIKVIGVGGGGGNAINHMFESGINGVDFVICNTDSQALQNSQVPNKIQLGVSLTEGLGAGANPDIGEQAAIESLEDIKAMLETSTKMAFITAGMGGGTGTGAAPIIAKLAREMDILTVGIVTTPFQFEGAMRCTQAQEGIEKLRANVDSLIVINNNKLREVYGNLGFKAGFSKADEVLSTAAKGIAEVITHHYTQNIDLRDAKTVLSNSGTSIMGSAQASGSSRAQEAIMKALDSPLLNDNKITGAKNVLLLIVSGAQEITIDEIGEINDHIQIEAGHSANIIMGVGEDESLGDAIAVTVIATGFHIDQQDDIVNTESKKIIHTLEDEQKAVHDLTGGEKPMRKLDIDQPLGIEEPVIKHQLEELPEEPKENELIPTTNQIKNLFVFYEEVTVEATQVEEKIDVPVSEDDFIIIESKDILDIEVKDAIVVEPVDSQEEQFAFTFDLPIKEVEKKVEETPIEFDLTDSIKNIEVDYDEVTPEVLAEPVAEKRYDLEEYMELESQLVSAQSDEPVVLEEELKLEKKTVAVEETHAEAEEKVDPFNSSISDLLKERADERKKKLKDFNYKFKNNNVNSIDEIEKEPAYKRQGVDIEQKPKEQKLSRTSLGEDSNDEMQLRSNNSFLHDNVD
ncbi:cell division protein FtsZ [Croceivirga thetidis]|uniref:Cell division protein FtsZ n=1 Tax=Croceivirga thetidis TaxID=2721623 RepID=A0ABX1GKG6_9FLAO|nr:cell division protein FtsZ [Croceivirga thetidis]NKI30398.1 cell division protein FtsZ [Croceivirga thetidis]